METVFITIHDLSLDARIKYCSDSVEDILGYSPHEVKGKSCWEYFHPDEIPFAKLIHDRGVNLDKAAVFNYCRIKHKNGSWVGAECVFTIVYDVLVASTAIYQRGPKSHRRAIDGAGIRRIFSSSPRDPRYHMLSYISNKFYQEPQPHSREPRAAFFLNRFTRTSTIMFATNGVSNILGLQPSQLIGKSFYYCIAPNCLDDAIRCLESAKANDSIAYLRFWFRDPTQESLRHRGGSAASSISEDEDDDGGVSITSSDRYTNNIMMVSPPPISINNQLPRIVNDVMPKLKLEDSVVMDGDIQAPGERSSAESQSRSSSDESNRANGNSRDAIFDPPHSMHQSSASSVTPNEEPAPIEVEAVVSCTSDGLIVVLRRARPLVPHTAGITDTPYYANGLFASPWANQPVMPEGIEQTTVAPSVTYPASYEPVESGFMAAIRDVAVFAWSLTGINGSLVDHARGKPTDQSLPPGGLPVWDPNAHVDAATNDRWNGFSTSTHRRIEDFPVIRDKKDDETLSVSSDDEVLFKRVPQQPPWRRPKRRAYQDAFGTDDGIDADREDVGTREIKRGRRHVESGK